MRGLWGRARQRRKPLVVLMAVVGIAGAVLATRDSGGGHLAANQAQLRKACDGTLPYGDLERLVRDERPGKLREHGTMLAPGQESRSLLDCSLSWGDGYGVTVHAEALVSDVPQAIETRDLLEPAGGHGTFVAPGTTGQYGERGAWLVTDCLGGLGGRVRPTTDLYVTARVTDGTGGAEVAAHADEAMSRSGKPDRATALLGFRTAVQVANVLTKAQHCGSGPLTMPKTVVDTDETHGAPGRALRKCEWIDGSSLPGIASGAWTTLGDLQESTGLSACAGEWDAEKNAGERPRPKEWQVTEVEAASWSGVLGRSAYDSYERAGHVPGWGARQGESPSEAGAGADSGADADRGVRQEDRVSSYAGRPQLALWARSVCGGRTTYHRVAVLPEIQLGDGETAVISGKDRTRLSTTARTVLDRYLDAEDGWPVSADCRDTKVLGEVEQWH
ncbi:hypothetical protein KN815_05590 [Streptomyces sp. 4503]|uniref:Secreted protein n=1 Tax=Streptomyces niphimycinicus TaxID=2842201 RepID=A0ABS6C9N5_9ACTN|nr:hypothetical protein [Streptomyces niphimycinicus]MBU3863579.1 hypothetical protein [Streptomyces niphimycinicus]